MIRFTAKSKIDRLSQLNNIDLKHNENWCTNFLVTYKHLCEELSSFFTEIGVTEQQIIELKEDDNEVISLIKSHLGYMIMPEHFYVDWTNKGSDFSYGDITTALRNFERINDDDQCVIKKSIATFESNMTKISKHNNERTAFVRRAMHYIYQKEA